MTEPRDDALLVGPEGAALWSVAFVRPSDWNPHVPFAMWLVDTLRPASILEMPVGDGQSYMAFCQAVDRLDLASVVTGIVLQQMLDATIRRAHDARFGRFSQIRTETSADALGTTSNGSLDLLHITAAHDFATLGELDPWLSKLSGRGVLLIDRPTLGLVGSELWEELTEKYPTFEFRAGSGLGVVAVGADVGDAVLALINAEESGFAQTVGNYFGLLGESVVAGAEARALQVSAEDMAARVDRLASERAELLIEQAKLREELHAQAAGGRREVDKARRKVQRTKLASAAKRSSLTRVRSRLVKSVGVAKKPGRAPRKRVGRGALSTNDDPSGAGRSTADLVTRIEESGLFDSHWYEHRYPDVSRAGMEPIRHFIEFGGPQLRDPNPFFDSRFFAATVRLGAGENPLERYLAADLDSRLPTSRWFDGMRYAQIHSVPTTKTALGHFISNETRPVPFPMPLREAKRIKVVFVSGESHTAGHRYRVEDFAAALPATHFDVVITSPADYPSLSYTLEGADFVWAWRVPWIASIQRILSLARDRGAVLVADIDDMVFSPDLMESGHVDGVRSLHLEPKHAAHGARLRGRALAEADLRVATTDFLVEQIRTRFGTAVEIPNGYDAESWAMSVKAAEVRPPDGLIRIGYAGGSLTHQKDLQVAIPAICKVLKENPAARFVAFSGFLNIREFPDLVECLDQVEWRKPVPVSRLALEYSRFSINIAPLELGNPFCDAKSALKFHEAALVGVPTVASPTAPFRNVIRHGMNGFVAVTEQDWYEHLSDLVKSLDKRADMAAQARQDVIWNFGPSRRGVLLGAALEVAAGRMTVQDYATVAPEMVYERFSQADVQSVYFEESGSAGRVTCLVVVGDDDEDGIWQTLESLLGQSEQGLDLVLVVTRQEESVPSIEDWARTFSDQFAAVRLVRARPRSTHSDILNWAYTASRTRSVVIARPSAAFAADFVYQLAETQVLSGSLAVLTAVSDGPEVVVRATDAFLLTAEGWAAVGGFQQGKDPAFELLERISRARLPTARLPTDSSVT
jgi:glycosyltransferase involved in cell wall biosynthesis